MTASDVSVTGPSFWWRSSAPPVQRPRLDGEQKVDVAVVGAGYTGLWTAYYLLREDPSLSVTVVEAHHAGFGASGRNGGWLTSALAGHPQRYARAAGMAAVHELQAEMDRTVDEVIEVAAAEGIDAGVRKGGELRVARNPAQLHRLRASFEAKKSLEPNVAWLDADALAERIVIAGALGAVLNPDCATVHPARLVGGLADAVERRGGRIVENSPALEIAPGRVRTPHGGLTARHVLVATEGFTCRLPGERRRWLPMNSSMIATEPISDDVWSAIGWRDGEALGDAAHMYMYAQRTPDGRLAIGGRGVPYRYGSRFATDGATPASTVEALHRVAVDMFPALAGVEVADSWSGVLGVPRDWSATVQYDPVTRLGRAGGYTGHGVATSNLAGRTLADLVLGRTTKLTQLPWVGWRSSRWEPEPLRWTGVHGLYAAYRYADRLEARPGAGPSALARLADRITRKP